METKCELGSKLEIDHPLGELSVSDRADLYCSCLQYFKLILCRPVKIVKHMLYNRAVIKIHFCNTSISSQNTLFRMFFIVKSKH